MAKGVKERWCCRELKSSRLLAAKARGPVFDSQQHHLSFEPFATSKFYGR